MLPALCFDALSKVVTHKLMAFNSEFSYFYRTMAINIKFYSLFCEFETYVVKVFQIFAFVT